MQINLGAATTPQDRKTVGRRQSESSSACAGKLWGVPPHRWSRSLQVGTMMDNGIQWACELSKYVEITESTSMTNSRQHPRRGGCCQCGGLDGNVLGTTQHKALLSPQKIAFVISLLLISHVFLASFCKGLCIYYKSIPVFMSRIIRSHTLVCTKYTWHYIYIYMLYKWFSSYMYNHFKSFQYILENRAFRFSPIKPIYLTIFVSGAPWFVVPMMPRRWDKGDDSMISSSILIIGKKGWIFFKGWKWVNSLTFPWSPVTMPKGITTQKLFGHQPIWWIGFSQSDIFSRLSFQR